MKYQPPNDNISFGNALIVIYNKKCVGKPEQALNLETTTNKQF